LSFLFFSIISKGYTALWQTHMQIDVKVDASFFDQGDMGRADYQGMIKQSMRRMFAEVTGRWEKRQLYALVSSGAAFQLRRMVLEDRTLIGKTVPVWVPADDDVDMLYKGHLPRDISCSGAFAGRPGRRGGCPISA
jgi:phosphate transport system permease protein